MATNGATGGAAAAAAHNQLVQAVRASGVIVQLEPKEFQEILAHTEKALVVVAYGGFLSSSYKYLVSYKGFAFYTKSQTQLSLPGDAQTVTAKKIWVPQ
ncbi:hypothetical protein EH223_17520 [candidate division KSB1 bacterium]|nr:hypothetical protein [candidate division KSB1 bacterium]RQW00776.1 MAG: hypothetical protein EH223_17520 [candidate division KSB1 bacterium]